MISVINHCLSFLGEGMKVTDICFMLNESHPADLALKIKTTDRKLLELILIS